MLEVYGGMQAQIVTAVREDGRLVGILSLHERRGPRAWAARRALVEMVNWLEHERGLTREQGYVLASVAADLRVAQVVNVPNGSVVCRLPLDVFENSSGQS